MPSVPSVRLRALNTAPARPGNEFVLYWMTSARRTSWNFALQEAAGQARVFGKPLLVVEVLTCGGRWDCDRFHHFVLQGMKDNGRCLTARRVGWLPCVEKKPGESVSLLEVLATRACLIVTDEFPRPASAQAERPDWQALPARALAVDSNGLLPLRAAPETFKTAHSFRRFLQREILGHLQEFPVADPLAGDRLRPMATLPDHVLRHWPAVPGNTPVTDHEVLAGLPLNHSVGPVKHAAGGTKAAVTRWRRFLDSTLERYAAERNEPEAGAVSGLSPYLHFGHISVHQVFRELADHEEWSPDTLCPPARGSRLGWWQMSEPAQMFLDQVLTWRELGYNMASRCPELDQYESLPEWARATLERHAHDPRPYLYRRDQIEQADTHDALWNAAQTQLVREGRIHNYLRMLWGKKILEWSPTPRHALEVMIHLNNKYALDGQNANSYSGIGWILGRYDRPWGPERPIFGLIRYMSSENTARKVRVREYLQTYSA